MVEGVEVKVPSFFWPVTCFVMFLAGMNPLVKLRCINEVGEDGEELENCKTYYVSVYDQNYPEWSGESWQHADGKNWLQADGNLTMFKLTHGLVNCESNCTDCDDEDCAGWDYGNMKKLDYAYAHYLNKNLPSFLTQMCNCSDFCADNCTNGLIALPGNDHMNAQWIDMDCKKLEAERDTSDNGSSGKICGLVNLYRGAYILAMVTLILMILLQFTMLGLEYVNFDSFLDGKCRCLFCPYWVKKTLYIFWASVCLGAQLYIYLLVTGETNDKLNAYFEVINGNFEYDWDTRGHFLFIASIVISGVTIVTMVFFMPKVERQKKKSYRNDIHGISTESIEARKF